MDKRMSFGIEGFSVLDDISDSQLAIVEIYVCHDGNNLHDMPIDLSVIKKAKKTLKNKFLVAGFDGNDFEGHETDEQIVGFFPESSEMKFVEKEGKTYLVAQAIMSKIYAKWAYDVFTKEDNERAVSMEITVLGTEIDDEGKESITKFVFNGVTLLGGEHMPACEGSNASIIKFSKENALKVYSKRLNNSKQIKKKFVEDMKLAEDLGKEESELEEKEIVETVTEEINSDESAYMSEEEEKTEESDVKEEKEEEMSCGDKMEEKEEMSCKDFESLTVEQKYEVFRSAVREALNEEGYLETYDDEYLYVYIYGEGYIYRYSYSLNGTNVEIQLESKTRVMRGGYIEFEIKEEEENKIQSLEKENCELKEKLLAYEIAEKENSVEAILSEVVDIISTEQIAELREESKEFSLEDLQFFANKVKAIAFEVVAKTNEEKKENFERMPINEEVKKTSKYGW